MVYISILCLFDKSSCVKGNSPWRQKATPAISHGRLSDIFQMVKILSFRLLLNRYYYIVIDLVSGVRRPDNYNIVRISQVNKEMKDKATTVG